MVRWGGAEESLGEVPVDPQGDGPALGAEARDILDRLRGLREADAPTHGGRVLSYVYDPGSAELDELAAQAIRIMQPVNGLDPTTFPSVAALERDLVRFARRMLHGELCDESAEDEVVVGSITSGGTESCLLAVKAARDLWRTSGGVGTPRLVVPSTVHAAFHKAAQLFGLRLDLVPVGADGAVQAQDVASRLGSDVALVVVSAPAYPHASIDPVEEVAQAASAAGIPCHVDACIGGWVLPWWGNDVPPWDFRVPGVTSISADLHKYGYAPKGVSVLLHRGRDRHRSQFFATTAWPGYPVVNPTLLGSRSASALAAAWAIVEWLGEEGFARLTETTRHATESLLTVVRSIEGLRVVGTPAGPLFAVAADVSVPPESRVDPHLWADAVRRRGWVLQQQPGLVQSDGSVLPPTTHLTVTPVTASGLEQLSETLRAAADEMRGVAGVSPQQVAASLPEQVTAVAGAGRLDSESAAAVLTGLGLSGEGGGLPEAMAPVMALMGALPGEVTERLLIELLARLSEPQDSSPQAR